MAQAEARQRALTSIDVSDPRLYQDDIWRPLLSQLRRDDPVHYGEASRFDLQEEILQRDLRFEIMGAPRQLHSNFIRGIRALPVRVVS
jgi:hypothetical protein